MDVPSGKMTADFVRRNWRDVMDYVQAGNQAVVSRSGKPVLALIPYEDFRALVDQLEDLYDMRAVNDSLARGLAENDPVSVRLHELRKEENPAWAAQIEARARELAIA